MSKKNIIESFFAILIISLVSLSLILLTVKNIKIREQIYKERLEYTEAYYDDLIEMLEEYYENEIYRLEEYYENEIYWLEKYYENKIKLLDKDTISVDQVMSDLDDLMEWTIRYYEVEPQTLRYSMELWEYILWKDSKLYERILNEWQG